jgi:hypothetical protein
VAIHHFAPRANRHSPCSFLFPGNLLDLQAAVRVGIKNCAAEQKQQRHFAVFKRVKVFRGRDIKIERARDNQHGFGSLGEPRHNAIRVCQEFVAQGAPPIFRSAEQLAQFFFLTGGVSALRRLNLNLRVQHNALNFFRGRPVNDFNFEMEQGGQAALGGFEAGNLEIKIRHEENERRPKAEARRNVG